MIVLIPAYEPDRRLLELVADAAGTTTVLVVDDGSGPALRRRSSTPRPRLARDVMRLPGEPGQGCRAQGRLRPHPAHHWPGHDVVCADSDGQHRPADIERGRGRGWPTPTAMVLGARRFTGRGARRAAGSATRVTGVGFRAATGRTAHRHPDRACGLPGRTCCPGWRRCRATGSSTSSTCCSQAVREGLPSRRSRSRPSTSTTTPRRTSVRSVDSRARLRPAARLRRLLAARLRPRHRCSCWPWSRSPATSSLAAVAARLVSGERQLRRQPALGLRRGRARPPAGWRAARATRYSPRRFSLLNVVLLDALVTVMGSVLPAKVVTEATLFLVSFVVQRQVVFARPAAVEVAPRTPVEEPAVAGQAIRRSASS